MRIHRILIVLVAVAFLLPSCATGGKGGSSPKPPLYQAVNDGDLEQVQKLVESGAAIDVGALGFTPLEAAASTGKLEIVKFLLSKGAKSPQKAFEKAWYAGKKDVSDFLLNEGYVDINNNSGYYYSYLKDNSIDIEKRLKNLNDAAKGKLTTPALLLLVEKENYKRVIDYFKIKLTDPSDALGRPILHLAADRNKLDLVNFLIENQFNVNVLDKNGQTALFYAITVFGPSIDWENPVIENQTDARIKFISDMPYYGDARAVQQTQISIVNALVGAGTNLNIQNKQGWTVLHFASAAYPKGLQEFLISKGADQQVKTLLGRTAAEIASLRK